ncbi:hypothetical protein MPTK1_Vg00155 [Marchantia polymorpha subsp. ruderalis]|nr:hypothetical protein Mp_Vg00155 [Marchantia polymorpha subsp. ruderalis]
MLVHSHHLRTYACGEATPIPIPIQLFTILFRVSLQFITASTTLANHVCQRIVIVIFGRKNFEKCLPLNERF